MVLVNVEDLKKELDSLMKRRGVTSWMQTAFDAQDILWIIEGTQEVDAVEVVRCEDCKHWGTGYGGETDHIKVCEYANYMVSANGYCVYGERKEPNV